MELYGLKTKDGLEYKLIVPCTVATNESIRVEVVEPEPEFKVGDWVIGRETYFYPKEPRLVTSIKDNGCLYYDDFDKTNRNFCHNVHLRHATPQEIEQHLRKICDEKYIGRKVESISSNKTDTIQGYQSFIFAIDQMWNSGLKWGILVYEKGKFAEIVPEKKKLPKTKKELKSFLLRYIMSSKADFVMDWAGDTDIFLNDYEDD